MTLSIHRYGDPVLRQSAVPVPAVTPEIRALVEEMIRVMHQANGVGLAAQQVGRTEAVCVVDVPVDYDQDDEGLRLNPDIPMPFALLNPEIVSVSKKTATLDEGCLSFPGISGGVKRPWSIAVRHLGLDGKPRETELKGYVARAVQHEIDHLRGVLFIDHFTHVKRLAVHNRLRRLQEKTRAALPDA
jgi:peptide deformylase